ncbi:tetratricopeptide repeat protein [Pseudooceanicola sp.]|uniref:tetratricopeptide repeat protein n=1 Tax=Pseudooceanicola sp. TaxID=1914328 RepID=UPI002632BD9B|nr:tetratricopeptide repeat protein [Pseudooceanicola sp.]MDF1854681.1 tetratricopeptide repeat protein [Pseudooceanicola sp.]
MRLARLFPAAILSLGFASVGLAAGGESSDPPKPTETTTKCEDGMVYDKATKKCVKADASLLNDDMRYLAARELAYGERYQSAMMVLDAAEDQSDPRILNYRGFVNRKLGNLDVAMVFYQQAIAADPDYVLARSYMGQGLIAQGDLTGALAQLREIEVRGGGDSWAYAALDQALRGLPTDY